MSTKQETSKNINMELISYKDAGRPERNLRIPAWSERTRACFVHKAVHVDFFLSSSLLSLKF